MAVIRFKLPDRGVCKSMVAVMKSCGEERASRRLARTLKRDLVADLTYEEIQVLAAHAGELPPRARPLVAQALEDVSSAVHYERERDERVKPYLRERREAVAALKLTTGSRMKAQSSAKTDDASPAGALPLPLGVDVVPETDACRHD